VDYFYVVDLSVFEVDYLLGLGVSFRKALVLLVQILLAAKLAALILDFTEVIWFGIGNQDFIMVFYKYIF
jgi:hypothetical protein